MYAAAATAIARARDGEGPTLIEARTFRFLGHVFGDDDKYMTKEEKAAAMAIDPLPILRARLIAEGIASEEEVAALQSKIEAEVADAESFGMASAFPDAAEIRRDVFAQEIAA